MKKTWIAAGLAALVAGALPAGADRQGQFISTSNSLDSSFGFHVYGTDLTSRGFSWDNDTTSSPIWGLNLARGTSYDGNLYLQSYTAMPSAMNMLEMRNDGGEVVLGQGVGGTQGVSHPGTTAQLEVYGGNSGTPNRGVIQADAFGNGMGLTLTQVGGLGLRTNIDFDNTFYLSTDSTGGGTPDFYLWDGHLNRMAWQVKPNSDVMQMNFGAQVNGTTILNGATSLLGNTTIGSSGSLVGFYGAAAQARPVISGSCSDGTALKSLISGLAQLGLVQDQTGP